MISLWTLLITATALSSQLTGADTPMRPGDAIDFFGDSITWQGGYIDLMSRRLQESPHTRGLLISLIKRGINGGKSNDLRDGCKDLYGCTQAPLSEVLKRDRPCAAVIEIGINDVWHGDKGNPPEVFEKCLRDMVASAKTQKVPVILATPSLIGEEPQGSNPFDSQLDQYVAIVKKVGADTGSIVVDLRASFVRYLSSHPRTAEMGKDRGMLTYDGVHMLPAGNALLADELETGIAAALRKSPRAKPAAISAPQTSLPLVPWPRSITFRTGSLALNRPVLVATSPNLLPLTKILAEEIQAKTGIKPALASKPTQGSIILKLAPNGDPESYRIEVNQSVTISAANPRGLAWGTVTLLQALQTKDNALQIRRMSIEDKPARPHRGLLIDVARRYHSIDVLKQCVELCRFYKLGYLQLHLTDNEAFTFPSRAFPQINTQNQNGGLSYTLEELKELVRFADERGVIMVPEMDIPGHSATLIRTMPDLFKIKGTKPYEHHATINFANSEVLKAIDTLIGEICDVFRTSPYFHMGGDEADISLADQHPDFQAAFHQLGLPEKSQHELYRRFLTQVDEMVKKRGKQLIVWEGFGRNAASKFPIPKDILVMEFENAYYLPTDLLEDGYSLVNASWTPLYVVNRHVWPARKVYEWDLSRFGRFSNLYETTGWYGATDLRRIAGAQVCSWEGPEETEIENLRRVAPAMAERVWNPAVGSSFQQFEVRLRATDDLFDRLVHSVTIHNSPLDATDPNGFDVPCFTKPLSVSLTSSRQGVIRFTLDGKPPTGSSPSYAGPVNLTQTTTIRAALFGPTGQRLGYETSKVFYLVPPRTPNLATGKKVTVSGGTQGPQVPELAVDDNLELSSSWWAGPAPQWLQVDLGKTFRVDRIEVFPYWDGSRYYEYTVEVSTDGQSWFVVADNSANRTPAKPQGDEIRFAARTVRFVKVNLLHNSANEAVHLVELRVWETKGN